MAGSYSWLTFSAAKAALGARLYDPDFVFTTNTECGIYLQQALRMFNALTNTWKKDFVFNPTQLWNSLATAPNSPRQRTLTDDYCYVQMENMLLEPPTGETWTGTPQFTALQLAQALQFRRDEILQVSNCNQQVATLSLMPNTRRTVLPDNVIEVARVRYLPVNDPYGGYGMGPYGGGPYGGGFIPGFTGYTLYRDDTIAQEWYESPLYQQNPGVPQTFMLSSEPPLAFDVDIMPSQPGTYEAIELIAGPAFAAAMRTGYGAGGYGSGGYGGGAGGPTLLNIPDDFAWVAIWGALSDLLGRESEATDRQRAEYCMKRYMDGLNLLLKTPWLFLSKINGIAVNVEAFSNMDRYQPEWDSNLMAVPSIIGGVYTVSYVINLPVIVTGGIDFFAAPTDGSSVGMTVLANAPVPVADGDFIQCSRSNFDTVLDFAQVLATFKLGGAEFQSVLEIEARAIRACAAENSRLKSTGSFSDILLQRGSEQECQQERYNTAPQVAEK